MDRLHLSHLAAANPFTLSGGEKRRLSVATALATAPRVLVLDEPTFGQDRRTWIELLELVAAQRADGTAVCFASHDRPFVDALADRVVALNAGGVIVAAASAPV
jgi:energy-coupling factor transport system ATP-binding protein